MPLNISVFILGGAATGLFMAVELAQAGLSVVLAEKRSRLASGPSTSNEGMLHRGTYHAAAVKDRAQAIAIARRCAYGYQRLLGIAPESVEDTFARSFVILSPSANIPEICERWNEAGVPYHGISIAEYRRVDPGVRFAPGSTVFEVQDKSVNARAIYRNLAQRARDLGVKILTDVHVDRVDPGANLVSLSGPGVRGAPLISAQAYVCTAGAGIKSFFEEKLNTCVPMRFWKSHLVDTPRLSRHNLFCIEPGQITLMHHGAWSIAGLNADALPIAEPSDELVPETVEYFFDRLETMFPAFDRAGSAARACTKVDVGRAVNVEKATGHLSLSFAFDEPVGRHFWVIPGKMTEVPCVAEAIVALLRERIPRAEGLPKVTEIGNRTTPEIAERPIDEYGPPRFFARLRTG
jgi:glycine/D-amino acid oxidase-like deaminating enzyme